MILSFDTKNFRLGDESSPGSRRACLYSSTTYKSTYR